MRKHVDILNNPETTKDNFEESVRRLRVLAQLEPYQKIMDDINANDTNE